MKSSTRRAGLAVSAVLVVACATARIDVDAYVGPLANTDEVLLEQTLAMAIGAKPLLVELRDKLEVAARGKSETKTTLLELRRLPHYRADYFDPNPLGEKAWFESADAERINSVLHLYEDLADPRVAELQAAAREYRELHDRLNARGAERALDEAVCPPSVAGNPGGLPASLQSFLRPQQRRDAKALLEAIASADGAKEWRVELPSPSGTPVYLTLAEARTTLDKVGANVLYEFLSLRAVWEHIAKGMYGEDSQEEANRKALAERGLAVSRSFHGARRQLRRMYEIVLAITKERLASPGAKHWSHHQVEVTLAPLALLVTFGEVDPAPMQPYLSSAAQASLLRLEQLKAASDWRDMTKPTRLRALLADPYEPKTPPVELARSAVAAIQELDELARNTTKLWPGDAWWRPISGAPMGKEANVALAKRRYGIVAGPVEQITDEAMLTRVDGTTLTDVLQSIASEHGLDAGRLAEGLDAQATHYLDAAAKGVEGLAAQRRTLLTTLAQFAEKLRVMSGFKELLGGDGATRSYGDVLTAIANSILVQIDSLQRSQGLLAGPPATAASQVADLEVACRELAAWRTAHTCAKCRDTASEPGLPPPPPCECAPTTPLAVLDALLARLRYLQIDATLADGATSARAARVHDAIQLAQAHRTGFARLRPAFEYLRSSSPASSLQQAPLLLTQRILGNPYPTEQSADELATAVSLDKQFWRNVNSVVVDGVGRTQYVIAKDDIGNWQVKSVSNDVSELMQTLGGLATFGLGGGVSPLARLDAARLTDLTMRARQGELTPEDKTELGQLRATRQDASERDGLLATHTQIGVQATEDVIAAMRAPKWPATQLPADAEAEKAAQGGFQPPELPALPKAGSRRDLLRASRARYEAMHTYLTERAKKDVETAANAPAPSPAAGWSADAARTQWLKDAKAALDSAKAGAEKRRAEILADLVASLRVLAATPPVDAKSKP